MISCRDRNFSGWGTSSNSGQQWYNEVAVLKSSLHYQQRCPGMNFKRFHFLFSFFPLSFLFVFSYRGIKFLAMDRHRLVKPTCFTEPEEVVERNCASIKAVSVLQHRRKFQAKRQWEARVNVEVYSCFFFSYCIYSLKNNRSGYCQVIHLYFN